MSMRAPTSRGELPRVRTIVATATRGAVCSDRLKDA
jgi:hypothetical protein